jgi:predicted  nucleic acid-binding Zn-ribbon protein
MKMAKIVNYTDIIKQVKNCPKDIFVDKLLNSYSESFEDLCDVRSAFYNEAINHKLPDDAPLVKRRRGDHASGARRLALDCYLLYSFISGSVSAAERKDIFSKSLTAANLLSDSQSARGQSPSRTPPRRRASGAGLPLSPMATPSQSGKAPPILLYDTLAEMKADIISFKTDQRADFEALQKQLDELSPIENGSNQNTNTELNEMMATVGLQIQECVNKIETLNTQLQRRTNRIVDLESEIKIVRVENTALRQSVEQNAQNLNKLANDKKMLWEEVQTNEIKIADWVDKCTSKHKTFSSKFKDLRSNDADTDRRINSIQKQLDNLKEPEYKKLCALRSELKCVKDQVSTINDDLDIQGKAIKENTTHMNSTKKRCIEIVKENKKLKRDAKCITQNIPCEKKQDKVKEKISQQ